MISLKKTGERSKVPCRNCPLVSYNLFGKLNTIRKNQIPDIQHET